jgi:hypothetical protein
MRHAYIQNGVIRAVLFLLLLNISDPQLPFADESPALRMRWLRKFTIGAP